MTTTTQTVNAKFTHTKKLSLKERFVKYLIDNAELFNSATAVMTGGRYIPLDK